MVVPVESDPTFTPGQPEVLLDATAYLGQNTPGYDVSPDGRRFLMTKPLVPTVSEITAVVNWFEELKARVLVP